METYEINEIQDIQDISDFDLDTLDPVYRSKPGINLFATTKVRPVPTKSLI